MKFLAPFNGILARAPRETGCPTPASVPLSGFLNLSAVSSKLEFHSLVSCCNRSWAAPLQSFPLAEIVYLSRGHWLPRSCPPPSPIRASTRLFTPRFPDVRANATQLPGSPDGYGFPFRTLHRCFPVPLRPVRCSLSPAASPASELSSPCESVRFEPVARHRRPLLSWSLALLETLPRPRILAPSLHRVLRRSSILRSRPDPVGPNRRPRRPFGPLGRVRLPPTQNECSVSLVGGTRPLARSDRTTSRRRLLLP
jgi:hypothetical protein